MRAEHTSDTYPRWLLYFGFFFNGLSVVMLGPMLPAMSRALGLSDWREGALLAAQFLGCALGSLLVAHAPRTAFLGGSFSSCFGLAAIVLSLDHLASLPGGFVTVCVALLFYGFGLGQVITSINLLMGKEDQGRISRISLGNALWSAGAILSPIIVALSLRQLALKSVLSGAAILFLLLGALFELLRKRHHQPPILHVRMRGWRVPARALMTFAIVFFLYGGAETCCSGWITTFAHRSVGVPGTISPLCTSAFWLGVAGGRALAGIVLRGLSRKKELYVLCGCALACSLALPLAPSMSRLTLLAASCGAFLGPIFPVAFSYFLSQRPAPRQTGLVLTACGLGASVMPLLLGILSQQLNSLRLALVIPAGCLLLMWLTMSLISPMNEPFHQLSIPD